jgi:hypothetical protein
VSDGAAAPAPAPQWQRHEAAGGSGARPCPRSQPAGALLPPFTLTLALLGVCANSVPSLVLPAGIKRLQNAQAQHDRFRVLLSDGEFSHSCMLATQLADLVHSNALKEGSIVTLLDYICNQVQNKK